MRKIPSIDYSFQNQSKFALLTVNNVYTDLPPAAFQLSNGTKVMPTVPVPDLGIWKQCIGSMRMERLGRANLVLFVEEPSDNPEILDDVHKRLKPVTCAACSICCTSSEAASSARTEPICYCSSAPENGVPGIRQMSQMPTFYQSKGWQRAPVTAGGWKMASLSSRRPHGHGRRQNPVQTGHSRSQHAV